MNDTDPNQEKISGNLWLSPNMIGMYVWVIVMYFVISNSDQKLFKGMFILAIGILFFMSYTLQMYYFLLD